MSLSAFRKQLSNEVFPTYTTSQYHEIGINFQLALAATANTTQVGTLVAVGSRTLVAGDRLSVDYAHAIQSTAGNMVTCSLMPN